MHFIIYVHVDHIADNNRVKTIILYSPGHHNAHGSGPEAFSLSTMGRNVRERMEPF